jgi:hypothetical protein
VAWFGEIGAGAFNDYEAVNAPLPGRLPRGLRFSLGDEYAVLETIDKLWGSWVDCPSSRVSRAWPVVAGRGAL